MLIEFNHKLKEIYLSGEVEDKDVEILDFITEYLSDYSTRKEKRREPGINIVTSGTCTGTIFDPNKGNWHYTNGVTLVDNDSLCVSTSHTAAPCLEIREDIKINEV